MNTRTMHPTGFYEAIEAPTVPPTNGRWLARLPVVVGVVVALTMWAVTVAGVLSAA